MANHDWEQNNDWSRRGGFGGDKDWDETYDYSSQGDDGPFAGVGPRNYHRSDERIFEDVCEHLTRHGRVDARHIRVEVKDGEVTLSGTVSDRMTKRKAEQVADRVRGVKDVHNQLRIEEGAFQTQGRGRQERGVPGGGKGRVDEVGDSGVYPASGPLPKTNAEVQSPGAWGQGERGSAGYEGSGRSEINAEGGRGRGQSGSAPGRRNKRGG